MFETARQSIISPRDKPIKNDIHSLINQKNIGEQKLLQDKIKHLKANFRKAIAKFFLLWLRNLSLVEMLYDLLMHYITRLKQTELALQKSENYLRAIVEAKPECINLIACDGTLLEINANGVAMMQAESANLLLGKPIVSRIVPEYREAFIALHKSVCEGNKGTLEFEIVGFGGTRRWLETHAVPLLNEVDGTFIHLAVMRDITPQKQAEDKIRLQAALLDTEITQNKQLEIQLLRSQRLESIGTLAGGIAHDLNNVLAPILLSIPLLQMKLPDSQSQHLLKILENNVKRGANLVKQILAFARGTEGKPTAVQISHLIAEIEDIIRGTFPKSIACHTHISENLCYVYGDATQLHQVLMNLVVNARDAMPEGGILTVSASNLVIDEHYAQMHIDAQVGNYVVITIADSGMGIPMEIQKRIFEPFFTTKEVGKGTGLGLSTAIGIIKNYGGFVNVYSEDGKGTQFQVYLPSSAAFEIDLPCQKLKPITGNGELILVVDDEAAIRDLTKSSLETYNYRVLTAADGVEAVAIYAQHHQEISVVLLDMMMPWMDGAIAIRTLQKINPDVKIIATSGLLSNQNIAESVGTGVKAFLSKPCTATELLQAVGCSL